jgi:WD40 repeat protein
MMENIALGNLSGDNLRAIAECLNPRDRLSLAKCSKRFLQDTWGSFALESLTNNFPFEQRMEFGLQVDYIPRTPSNSDVPVIDCDNSQLRIVPERSQMQHCFVSVSSDGTLVAVLAYDNVIRILNPFSKVLKAELRVDNVCPVSIWDLRHGKHVPFLHGLNGNKSYEEDVGIDAEIGFFLSQDAKYLVLSGKTHLYVYSLAGHNIHLSRSLQISTALKHLDQEEGVGGSSALSPDNETVSWIIFAGRPASIYVTRWSVKSEQFLTYSKITTIYPSNKSALGWARVQFSPNGRFIIAFANNAKKAQRTIRVGEHSQIVKCSEYTFAAYDISEPTGGVLKGTKQTKNNPIELEPIKRFNEWLDLSPDSYPVELTSFILLLVGGVEIHDVSYPQGDRGKRISQLQEMRIPRLHFNFLHSCLSEATLKGFSFVPHARHKWFVTKQPMYSIHIGLDKNRALMTVSPHGNKLFGLDRNIRTEERRRTMVRSNDDSAIDQSCQYGNSLKRVHAFHGMPWKACFAAASGFSASGKWLASVNLVDDRCIVCVRNITVREYFS